MKGLIGTVAMIGAVLLPVPAALACAPLAYVEQGGETYAADSPRGWAREQAEWRARAEAVFLAQVSAMRLARDYGAAFTFTPIAPLYDTPLPDPVPTLRRHRGNPATSRWGSATMSSSTPIRPTGSGRSSTSRRWTGCRIARRGFRPHGR